MYLQDPQNISPPKAGSAFVILVVDDDPMMLDITQACAEDFGYRVIPAGDIGQARDVLASPQALDALLTDIRLHRDATGGYDLAREAIVQRPDLRVCYMTGDTMTADTSAAFVSGAHYLQKPYRAASLEASLRSLFQARARGTRPHSGHA